MDRDEIRKEIDGLRAAIDKLEQRFDEEWEGLDIGRERDNSTWGTIATADGLILARLLKAVCVVHDEPARVGNAMLDRCIGLVPDALGRYATDLERKVAVDAIEEVRRQFEASLVER